MFPHPLVEVTMRITDKRKKFWMNWGEGQNNTVLYKTKNFRKVDTFENDACFKLLLEDEDGKQIEATFEPFRWLDQPVLGLHLLSIIRTDTNEAIEVDEGLFRHLYETALFRISESDKDLMENVPAW